MKNRIFKNKITSILGLLVCIASLVSVFVVDEVTWTEAVIGMTFGVGLICAKDKLPKIGGGATVLVLVLVAGCKKPPTVSTGVKEIVKETYKEVQVPVAGGAVTASLSEQDLNTIKTALQNGKDTVFIKDRNQTTALKFYLDAMGNLKADCENKDRFISYLQKQIETERENTKTVTHTEHKVPVWCWLIIGGLGATTVTFSTLFQIQRITR